MLNLFKNNPRETEGEGEGPKDNPKEQKATIFSHRTKADKDLLNMEIKRHSHCWQEQPITEQVVKQYYFDQ